MPSPHLNIDHVADTGQKAPVMNEQTDLLDRALNQHVIIDVGAGGQIVITEAEAKQNVLLRLTGAPGGNFELIMPIDQRLIAIHNQATDGSIATIGVATTSGTWDTVAAGEKAFFHIDGENAIKLASTVITSLLGVVEAFSGFIETPREKTYVLEQFAKFAYSITDFTGDCGAGSLTISIEIDGTPVTGIDGVTFNTSESTETASANNDVAVGQTVTMVVTDLDTDTAEDFAFTMQTARA